MQLAFCEHMQTHFLGGHSTPRSPGFGQTLLQKIQAVKPKAHLFGHIHESRQGSSVRNFSTGNVIVLHCLTQVEDGRDATPQRRKRVGPGRCLFCVF